MESRYCGSRRIVFIRSISIFFIGMLMSVSSIGQVNILTQGFEALPFPPTGWSNVRITGPSLPGNWARVTAGTFPVQAPHGGSYEIRFNSHNFLAGTSGDLRTAVLDFSTLGTYSVGFWMYRDSWSGNDKLEVYANTVQTSVGGTLMGTINRDLAQSPFEPSNGWYHYSFTVPGAFTGTTNYIIFKATSAYGNDIYLDDITVDRLPPAFPSCLVSFTPVTGTTGYCMNASMDWSSVAAATGYKITMGSNAPSYNNVANNLDLGPSLSYSAVVTASTTYGWKVVPYNAFGDASGCSFNTFTTGSSLCYCTPVYTDNSCTSQDYIQDFYTTGGTTNISNMGSGCTANPNNFTLFPMSVTCYQGNSFTLNMQSGPDYAEGFAVWIDWNQDGDFSDAGEFVYSSASATIALVSGSVTVPVTASLGNTRLRVRCAYNYVPTSAQSCTTFTEGETEDYTMVVTGPLLPITLTDFYGELNNELVDLYWHTQNEVNSNFFRIEKSRNGIDFSTIAQVPAKGNSNALNDYSVTDDAPFIGMNYYRLSLIDNEGIIRYSDILNINRAGSSEEILLAPNPVHDQISVHTNIDDTVLLMEWFSVSGEKIFSSPFSGSTTVDVSTFPKGIYLVHITGGNYVFNNKIVIN